MPPGTLATGFIFDTILCFYTLTKYSVMPILFQTGAEVQDGICRQAGK